MGFGSMWHWIVVLLVILFLFGGKKIPELAKGLGKGIKTFKKEMEDDEKVEQVAEKKAEDSSQKTTTNENSKSV